MADKPKHIGMIAHIDAGKATLTAATSRIVAQPALPPVDGLEVVAWRWPEPMAEGSKFHSVTNAEPPCSGWQELVTLSQASSVIAGLERELEVMTERQSVSAGWCHIWKKSSETAEARISSLEKENKRLREAIDAIADFDDPDDSLDPNVIHLIRIAGAARRAARQALEDHNG